MTEISSQLACPRCGTAMVRRRNRRDLSEFWGCPRYPACRGTRPLEAIGPRRAEATATVHRVAAAHPTAPRVARPGGSAQREYERRRQRHKEQVWANVDWIVIRGFGLALLGIALTSIGPMWQLLGWLIVGLAILSTLTRLLVPPDHVLAWRLGAKGEQRTAEILAKLAPEGFVAIYDRKMPWSTANIDAIVVGPPGVFVVETKNHGGRLIVRGDDVFVRGRREDWITQVERQIDAVMHVVGDVPVRGVIHAVKAELPWRAVVIDGIPIVGPRGLVRFIRNQPRALSSEDISAIASLIESKLKPATTAEASPTET